MKILIAGGTGFIGRQLVPALMSEGHALVMIGRDKKKIDMLFSGKVEATTWDQLNDFNPDEITAIVNLVGENIADKRWSQSTKDSILNSRIQSTTLLAQWASKATKSKPHLYNASAVGFYGLQEIISTPELAFTERSAPLTPKQGEFCGPLVMKWEDATMVTKNADFPVTIMRFGVVLKRGEGILKKLELPAKAGLGAMIGTGKQPIAWIDCVDLIQAIIFLIQHPDITGPVNLVAPHPVSQKEFTDVLAKTLHRPTFLKLPSWFVKMVFGQMGEELLLAGQTVLPERLLQASFKFRYPTIKSALAHELSEE